jgi:predicted nucleic acid-binding Zn ribbon protein
MFRVTPRLTRLLRTRMCGRCGSSLQPERQRKYDAFWIIFLIWLGSALAFYLIGLLLIGAGLWLWSRKKARWVCPSCTQTRPAISAS